MQLLRQPQFTATSMIGMIALAGIIVRNSILLVDFINQEVRSGAVRPRRRCVRPRCGEADRADRPGHDGRCLLPARWPDLLGLAVSLIFGLFVSTILTLDRDTGGLLRRDAVACCGHHGRLRNERVPLKNTPRAARVVLADFPEGLNLREGFCFQSPLQVPQPWAVADNAFPPPPVPIKPRSVPKRCDNADPCRRLANGLGR